LLRRFLDERAKRGLIASVYVTETSCLGVCPKQGGAVVVYPEACWYTGVTEPDVADIFSEHLVGGRPVERLVDERFFRDPS
jgi:NADP-reducing hydrogenase subunit HndC